MPTIHLLANTIANQIAAGEVIERPANVVKELLENSLDAKASRINIQFSSGGTNLISISDNGIGMDAVDALQCFNTHATSKLQTFLDLQHLNSFGFRGEALPSIASVAQVTLVTRTQDQELGTRVEIDGELKPKQMPCACNVGTTIIVKHLFYNLPVRRTFLKSEYTENAHIIDCVRLYAVAYPQIQLELKQDASLIFSSSPCSTIEQRIHEIWPKQNSKTWIPLQYESKIGSLSGVISTPGAGETSSQAIRIFLNQRPIAQSAFSRAILEGYQGFIPPQLFPSVFLFLTLPTNTFDVNVHPMKKEVRFKQEAAVHSLIIDAIRKTLTDHQSASVSIQSVPMPPKPNAPEPSVDAKPKPTQSVDIARWVSNPVSKNPTQPQSVASVSNPLRTQQTPTVQPPMVETPVFPLKLITVWQNRYAFFDESPILVILDCKGAQMRIWYERIVRLLKKEQVGPLQTLLYPYIFSLDGPQAIAFAEAIDYLNLRKVCLAKALPTGQFQIDAIPQWLPLEQIQLFVHQTSHALIEWGQMQSIERQLNPLLLKLVQQQKFSEVTTAEQVKSICEELKTCSNYVTTPNGSFIWNRLSPQELMKSKS